jgi:3D (Asp-Asp-Asp) domain-containing protein
MITLIILSAIIFQKYSSLLLAGANSLLLVPQTTPVVAMATVNPKTESVEMEFWITAYSSTPEETDDTPFITASGKIAKDGFAATNSLPFGTKIQIPEIFGDKIFVVEDRMHRRKNNFLDIWMSTKEQALKFGIKRAKIKILNQ